jgi:hypothetical protein
MHIPKQLRDKLSAKAKNCIFLGQDPLTKGYRCFCPKSKKIFICWDVTFDKSTSGAVIPGNETPTTFPMPQFCISIPTFPCTPASPSSGDLCNHASEPTLKPSFQPKPPEPVSIPGSPTSPTANSNSSSATRVYTRHSPPHVPIQPTLRHSTRPGQPSVLLDGFIGDLEKDNLTYAKVKHDPNWQ